MKILILGAGRVGSSLASTLSKQDYEVSIVDLNKDKLLRLQEDYDLATEIGHASHPNTLERAGADQDTILLAVTNSDECNITSCQFAKSKFSVKKTICRLSDSSYLESLEAFGEKNIDIAIGPENEVTEHLVDLIKHPGAEQIESFANGSLKVGQFISAEILLDSYKVPMAVKATGLQSFRDFTVVYAKVDEQYEVRMLELGRKVGSWVEVLGGIAAGTEYVAKNSYIIKADIDKSGASHDHQGSCM